MRFFNTLLEILFPVNCVSCGVSGTYLCTACLASSPPTERESAKWVFPFYDYRHPPIKTALWLLKYKGKKRLARTFAEVLHGKIMEEIADLSLMENFYGPILIPVPLSKKRYRERGYNQSELICRELVKISEENLRKEGAGVSMTFKLETNILLKLIDTEHQAHIRDRSKRIKNLEGTFAVRQANDNTLMVKGRNIILIDDITTTGATLTEARKTLEEAGARKVVAFTVAH